MENNLSEILDAAVSDLIAIQPNILQVITAPILKLVAQFAKAQVCDLVVIKQHGFQLISKPSRY